MKHTSTWHQIGVWLTTKANYTGDEGAVHRFLEHIVLTALALAVTMVIAMPLAIALSRWKRGGVFVTSLANAARAVPILGILILLAAGPLGVNTRTAIVALVIFAIPPILTNTYTGLREVDPDLVRAAVGMGMTGGQRLRKVELPLALPLIATGIRLAAIQLWATATLAAIVGAGGLGKIIVTGYAINDRGAIYGGVLIIVVFALLLEGALALAEGSVRRRFGDTSDVRSGSAPAQPAQDNVPLTVGA